MLLRTLRSGVKISRSQTRWMSSAQNTSDAALLKHPSFQMIKSFYRSFSKDAQQEISSLFETGAFVNRLHARFIYSYLQLPVIKKYGFDFKDFYEGVQNAIPNVISAFESKEFLEFSRTGTPNDVSNYLLDVVHPSVFSYLRRATLEKSRYYQVENTTIYNVKVAQFYVTTSEALQQFNDRWKGILSGLTRSKSPRTPSVLPTSKATVNSQNTNSDEKDKTEANLDVATVNTSDSPKEASSVDSKETPVDDSMNILTQLIAENGGKNAVQKWMNTFFPSTSTVLLCEVEYVIKSEMKRFNKKLGLLGEGASDNQEDNNNFVKKSYNCKIIFEGCLSGEAPLEWKVVSMK